MKTLHNSTVQKHIDQVLQPTTKSYTFKKRKTSGVFQLDEYETKTVEATSSMTAWAIVGYDWMLYSIDKEL